MLATRTGGVSFTQSSPSLTWVITHNLNTLAPAIDCWIDDGGNTVKIIPSSVEATDANNVTVTFSISRAGNAIVT